MSVKIYSTTSCPWCNVAKNYFKEIGVQYEDYNVGEDHEKAVEMVKKSGQRGVPVIDIDGKIIVGFNKEAIDELVKK